MVRKSRTIVAVTPMSLDRDSRTLKQARSLAAAGYRSLVVAAGRAIEVTECNEVAATASTWLSAPSVTHRRFDGLRQANVPWLVHAGLFGAWLGLYALRSFVMPFRQLPRADLYILHECSTYPAVALRARLAGVPYIYDAHDNYSAIEPASLLPPFDQRFVVPFTHALEARAMRGAAAVMTVSDGLGEVLRQAFGPHPVVVRNAHDPRLDRAEAAGLRQRFHLGADAVVLATVGNAKRGQALEQAIAALALLPENVHWAFIGDGYQRLIALAQQKGVAGRVHLTGRLQPDAIVPTIRDADIAVILYYAYSENYSNALPNGLFQAIAAGLPQIVPPLPEISRLTSNHRFGIEADPTEPAAIAVAVEKLTKPDGLRAKLAAAGRHAATQLIWPVEETRFLDLVASVLPPATHGGDGRSSRLLETNTVPTATCRAR